MAKTKLFIGGIRGVGKGSLCKKLVEAYLCEYVSASALLNWNKKSKQVQDVSRNQKILAELLAEKHLVTVHILLMAILLCGTKATAVKLFH